MKKALVISLLLVVGLGLAAFAGPLSGSWSVSLKFTEATVDSTNVLSLSSFGSVLTLDYTTCGWTFGSTAIFSKTAFANLFFEAEGSVGAFGFYGGFDFYPQSASFVNAVGAVDLSIAGATVYGIGVIYNHAYKTSATAETGVGFILGGYGIAGDCSIWVESQWNMSGKIYYVWAKGYDYVIDSLFDYDWCDGWSKGLTTTQSKCTAVWSGLDIYIEYPFACFDLLTKVNFDCTNGFDFICFEIDDICLGIDWLILDDFNICFGVDYKQVCADIDLVLGDCVCFTPYVSLDMSPDGTAVYGIVLNALEIEYDMGQGVTFKAGDLLNKTVSLFRSDDDDNEEYEETYCFQYDGTIVSYGSGTWSYSSTEMCCYNVDYEEYFAILIDGDACCGGAFSVSIFNWFDTDTDAANLFDWQETSASLKIGIGSNTTLSVGLSLLNTGLNTISVGATFAF